MKVKKLEIFQSKMNLKGCIWASWNTRGAQSPLSHLILKLDNLDNASSLNEKLRERAIAAQGRREETADLAKTQKQSIKRQKQCEV